MNIAIVEGAIAECDADGGVGRCGPPIVAEQPRFGSGPNHALLSKTPLALERQGYGHTETFGVRRQTVHDTGMERQTEF